MKWLVDEMISYWNDELMKWPIDEMTHWWNGPLMKWPVDVKPNWRNDLWNYLWLVDIMTG